MRDLLLRERTPGYFWVGELSTSALSTATAVMALHQVRKADCGRQPVVSRQLAGEAQPAPEHPLPLDSLQQTSGCRSQPALDSRLSTLNSLIAGGIDWLIAHQNADGGWGDTVKSFSNISTTMLCHASLAATCDEPAAVSVQQSAVSDGEGRSRRLAMSSRGERPEVHAPRPFDPRQSKRHAAITRAAAYIDRAGGVPALVARYGQDKTFSVPILTHCALAGLVDWSDITPLPFELACVPARFYKAVRLPVVSYALPALIAIGQVRHHFAPTWNPLTRVLRNLAKRRSLAVLARIQPPNGGFLEATPLTSFVTMSLAAMGLVNHPVVQKGVEFIVNAVRPDGSWPIDTNLSTWVTTLAVNALGDDLPEESRLPILIRLLDQQFTEVHPYTNADPGGWAWTPLPGGVPDADDTAGAVLALVQLSRELRVESREPERIEDRGSRIEGSASPSPAVAAAGSANPRSQAPAWERTPREAPFRNASPELATRVDAALTNGVQWLLGLQNRDGGFPTFCRGWGALPFDRSSPDITAHCLRAFSSFRVRQGWANLTATLGGQGEIDDIIEWATHMSISGKEASLNHRSGRSQFSALSYLKREQRADGAWLPLWFGNQHVADDSNGTYGTTKVVLAFRDCEMTNSAGVDRGFTWLRNNQNPDGGWGAGPGTPSSVEETSLAVEALLDDPQAAEQVARGLTWLVEKVEAVPSSDLSDPQSAMSMESLPYLGTPPRTIADPAPIGFYFAKLWYFERLYPLIFAVSCLRRAVAAMDAAASGERMPADSADV